MKKKLKLYSINTINKWESMLCSSKFHFYPRQLLNRQDTYPVDPTFSFKSRPSY